MRRFAPAAVAVLALAGCSQNSAGAGGGQTAEAPAATAPEASAPAAVSTGAPRQRPGLWRVTTVMEGIGSQTQDQCVTPEEAASAALVSPQGMDGCAAPQIRRDGAAWVATSVCGTGEARSEVITRVTGDFQSSMAANVEMRTAGATTMRMQATGTYVGPCPAA